MFLLFWIVWGCSVAKLGPALCEPVDCSMLEFRVLHYLLEFAQVYVHEVCMLSSHSSSYCPLLLLSSIFPSIRVFSNEPLFASGGQSVGASASASVLPVNIQDWFPLGWTDLPAVQGILKRLLQLHSLKASVSQCSAFFSPTLTWVHDYWKTPYLWLHRPLSARCCLWFLICCLSLS